MTPPAAKKETPEGAQPNMPGSFLTDQQNADLFLLGAYAIGAAALFRILFSAMYVVYVLAFPAFFLYALQTCPSMESFDAKKELKRVLRGYHLSEDDPNKPKGFLGNLAAKISASVATEMATGLGYEIAMYPILGAAIFVAVRVPGFERDVYWIGVFGKWRYLYQKEIVNYKTD